MKVIDIHKDDCTICGHASKYHLTLDRDTDMGMWWRSMCAAKADCKCLHLCTCLDP